MKDSAMSRRNAGSYRERNGIGSTSQSAPAHAATPERQDEIDAWRVKQELADTRAALNLARERAEDAEADLEEARLELDQFRIAPATSLPIRPAPTPSPAPIESPAVTAIAAELVAVMAENDRRAATAPVPAPRKRRAVKPKVAPASVPAS
jgi:hypothetical protein